MKISQQTFTEAQLNELREILNEMGLNVQIDTDAQLIEMCEYIYVRKKRPTSDAFKDWMLEATYGPGL